MSKTNGSDLVDSFADAKFSEGNKKGLTKREYFASMAMQGLLVNNSGVNNDVTAKQASVCADALIKALNNE